MNNTTLTATYIDEKGLYYMCIQNSAMYRWRVSRGVLIDKTDRGIRINLMPSTFDINKTGWRPVQRAGVTA